MAIKAASEMKRLKILADDRIAAPVDVVVPAPVVVSGEGGTNTVNVLVGSTGDMEVIDVEVVVVVVVKEPVVELVGFIVDDVVDNTVLEGDVDVPLLDVGGTELEASAWKPTAGGEYRKTLYTFF